MKLNLYTKLLRSINCSFHLILYSTCRASPVTAQRPSRGAFSHKKPPCVRSLWPVFHMQFHLPYFLEEPRGANLQLLRRPRTLSEYFSAREGTIVWKCWPSLIEYCFTLLQRLWIVRINSVIRCPPHMIIAWFQSRDVGGYDCLKNNVRTARTYRSKCNFFSRIAAP